MLGLLTYGGTLVASGEITVGALTSLLVYTFYIGSSLIGLTSFFGYVPLRCVTALTLMQHDHEGPRCLVSHL